VALPNVLVSLLLAAAFYRVVRLFLPQRRSVALLGAGVFSLLVTNHVWVRHVVPYDTALLLCLISLHLALRNETPDAPGDLRPALAGVALPGLGLAVYPLFFYRWRALGPLLALAVLAATAAGLWVAARRAESVDRRRSIAAGIVGGLSLSVYPAYYPFHAGVLALIALGGRGNAVFSASRARARAACLHGLSLLLVLASFEVVARVGGGSYFAAAARLSSTITQGSFEEGFCFLPKYCWEVEGWTGVLLLLLASAFFAGLVVSRSQSLGGRGTALTRFVLLCTCLYLVYACQSAVLHKMTFTGRYLRMYLPALVLAAMAPIAAIAGTKARRAAVLGVGVVSVVSFLQFAREYSRQGYPVNALYELGIGFEDVPASQRVYESSIMPDYNLPVKALTVGAHYRTHADDPRFVLVNFGWFDLEGRAGPTYSPPDGSVLLYRAPHFQCFRSSRFEAWGIDRRREFRERHYELRVYEILRP
jgi:hypothetical protein